MSYDEAFEAAARALRHRDRTAEQLDQHLASRGFDESDRREAVAALERTGVVDDARYAENRALSLGRRGAGDAYVRHDLASAGLTDEVIAHALAGLEPEHERAERVVARRGANARTARYLAAKGFSDDVVRSAVAQGAGEALG